MFTFGDQLYRLTQRDEETLLVSPEIRRIDGTVAAAAGSGSLFATVPLDRMIYVHSITALLRPAALNVWKGVEVNFRIFGQVEQILFYAAESVAGNLVGDGQSAPPGAAGTVSFNRNVGLVLPQGTDRIGMLVERNNTTNAANFSLYLNAWVIPPGRFGRA